MSWTEKTSTFLLASILIAVSLCGCTQRAGKSTGSSEPDARPVVVATIPMIADIARQIGDSYVKVETLLGHKDDPHTYQPNGADIKRLTAANAVLYNGLLLEGAIQADLEKLGGRAELVVAVGDQVSMARLRTPPDFDGHPDPHIWMDPTVWAETVPAILDALQQLVPDKANELAENAKFVERKLNLLDAYSRRVIDSIPENQRHLVTAHDAFGYFGAAYSIEVSSVQGVTTESEAGLEDVQNLVNLIVEKSIPAIFFESSVSERNLNAIRDGVRAKGREVAVGGVLFSDSAGPEGTWEGTYFGMIEHNVNTVASALGGRVPDGGFREFFENSSPTLSNDAARDSDGVPDQ